MKNHEIWQAVLAELELSPNMSKPNFVTWFRSTDIINYQNNEVVICVPSTFYQTWLAKKYHQMIVKSLERVTGKPIKKLEYKIGNIKNFIQVIPPTDQLPEINVPDYCLQRPQTPMGVGKFGLNTKYIFTRFVLN